METYFDDKEFGRVHIRMTARAKHYSIKITKGEVWGIIPIDGDVNKLVDFIQSKRKEIKAILTKRPAPSLIDEQTVMQTATFQLRIFRTERENFYMKLDDEILSIACPNDTVLIKEPVQDVLKNMMVRALRHEAKRVLPNRIIGLAKQHGFTLTGVKINSSRTHWGSCTGRKSVNLSLHLMILPWHLIDYVLLHELCHTIEMNHSERFWGLMNQVTDGKAMALRKELKQYHML